MTSRWTESFRSKQYNFDLTTEQIWENFDPAFFRRIRNSFEAFITGKCWKIKLNSRISKCENYTNIERENRPVMKGIREKLGTQIWLCRGEDNMKWGDIYKIAIWHDDETYSFSKLFSLLYPLFYPYNCESRHSHHLGISKLPKWTVYFGKEEHTGRKRNPEQQLRNKCNSKAYGDTIGRYKSTWHEKTGVINLRFLTDRAET